MFRLNRWKTVAFFMVLLLAGGWTVYSQISGTESEPKDFDPTNPRDIPDTTVINLQIIGLAQIGDVKMIEGIGNETSVTVDRGATSAGPTSYAPLVMHGVFHRLVREWRDAIIAGTVTKREIQINLINSAGRRALRIRFFNAWPISFTIPPLNVDGSTRYLERVEFIYDRFTIEN